MDQTIQNQLIQTSMRLRNMKSLLPVDLEISIGEYIILRNITIHAKDGNQICMSDIMDNIPISKPAVSQILNQLEKKGYIIRKSNREDQRRISLQLTKQGQTVYQREEQRFETSFDELISRMGKDNIMQLIYLLDLLTKTAGEIKKRIRT